MKPDRVFQPRPELITDAVLIVSFGIAMYTKKRWYHGLVAILWLLLSVASFLAKPEPGS